MAILVMGLFVICIAKRLAEESRIMNSYSINRESESTKTTATLSTTVILSHF